jgi:hypothetical protein
VETGVKDKAVSGDFLLKRRFVWETVIQTLPTQREKVERRLILLPI